MLGLMGNSANSASLRNDMVSDWTGESSAAGLQESWKKSRLFSALEVLLSNSGSSTMGENSHDSDEGYSMDWRWKLQVDQSSSLRESNALFVTSLPNTEQFQLTAGPEKQGISSRRCMQDLPAQTLQLLDVYFSTTHSWFPIIAKDNMIRASSLYANTQLYITAASPGSGDHAALWAILSYTVVQLAPASCHMDVLSLAKEYYAISRGLIPSAKDHRELGHVQALLLLSLINIGLEDWTTAWLLSDQAVHMAVDLHLGTLSDIPWSGGSRYSKAAFLGCFILDSLLSFRLQRPPNMDSTELAHTGLLDENGPEEWNCWRDSLPFADALLSKSFPRKGPLLALSCFNRFVELASVLNIISRGVSSGRPGAAISQCLVPKLKQWEKRLPLGCRFFGADSIYPERHAPLLPHQTYLGLSYLAALLWLYLRTAPLEQRRDQPQRPAVEGAKKLLYRALYIVSQHVETFPTCGLPPIFEFSLRVIAEQGFTLCHSVQPGTFPLALWLDIFRQKVAEIGPRWPIYNSLTISMERLQKSVDIY